MDAGQLKVTTTGEFVQPRARPTRKYTSLVWRARNNDAAIWGGAGPARVAGRSNSARLDR